MSLIRSISLYDKICSSHCARHDVDVPAADDFTAAGSISSALFSVENLSSDECSYSYSLRSDSFPTRESSYQTHFKQFEEDGGTIDTSGYSGSSFDVKFMSRHAGLDLDYNGQTLPKDASSTSSASIKAVIASHDDIPQEFLQSTHKNFLENVRITKDYGGTIVVTTSCQQQQLEKTFDSSDSDDLSTSDNTTVKLLPPKDIVIADERKGNRVGRWLRRRNPLSALVRSMTTPAA
jgi:hypothetical protein